MPGAQPPPERPGLVKQANNRGGRQECQFMMTRAMTSADTIGPVHFDPLRSALQAWPIEFNVRLVARPLSVPS